jgi:hypothetical protein
MIIERFGSHAMIVDESFSDSDLVVQLGAGRRP